MMNRIESCEVAKIVRGELKKHFPATKFSVKTSKYAGGSSIDVKWTDGPTVKQVEKVAGKYHGAQFDGMIDLKSHNGMPYENDYIFFTRAFSVALWTEAARNYCRKFRHTVPTISVYDWNTAYIKPDDDIYLPNGYYLSNLINAYAHTIAA